MKRLIFIVILFLTFSCFVSSQEKKTIYEKNLISSKESVQTPIEGKFLSPLASPSGKILAFSKDNFKGIYLLNLETGKIIELTDLEGSGFGYEWQEFEDVLAFRGSIGNLKRKHFICVGHPDGVVEVASPLLQTVSLPVWIDENVAFVVWGKNAILKIVGPTKNESCLKKILFTSPEGKIVNFKEKEREESKVDGKVFFLPRYSRDGKNFILHCLDGGIYYGSIYDGSLKKVAEGGEARFGRDDSVIIFEKTKDDGHIITESDLFLYDIKSEKTFQLTDTKEIIERMPSMANDGHTIFWVEDGKIMRGVVK